MNTYTGGTDLPLTVSLGSLLDRGLSPVGVAYQVEDENALVVVPSVNVAGYTSGDPEVQITIPGSANSVAQNQYLSGRVVRLTVIVTGGIFPTEQIDVSYLLRNPTPLVAPTTSFQTLLGAEIHAQQMTGFSTWCGASDSDKIRALREAYLEITALSFHYRPEDWQSRVNMDVCLDQDDWDEMSVQTWNGLEPEFRNALCRAQVAQAAYLIGQNCCGSDEDELFVLQKTVDKSSTTWSRGRPIKRPLCKLAMKQLSHYLVGMRIGRA